MAKKNLGFNVKGTKVSYSQNCKGQVCYGTATLSPQDEFNEELGKAIAYARCDLMMRKQEIRSALATKEYLEEHIGDFSNEEWKIDEFSYNRWKNSDTRFSVRFINALDSELAHMRRMLANQKKLIQLLTSEGQILAGKMTYKQILNKTLKIVIDKVQYK